MRNGDQRKEKPTAATVSFQDEQGRCTTPLADILGYLAPFVKSRFPEANGRVERALELARDSRNVIEVKSSGYENFWIRGNGRWYLVTPKGCECPDHTYRAITCKHMLARLMIVEAQRLEGTRPGRGV